MKMLTLALIMIASNVSLAQEANHLKFFGGQVSAELEFDDTFGPQVPSLISIPLLGIVFKQNGKPFDPSKLSAVMYLTRAPNTTRRDVYVAQQEGVMVPPIPGSYYASFDTVNTIGNWSLAITATNAAGKKDTEVFQFEVE